jgi:ATP-dependent Clp protease protease subunit
VAAAIRKKELDDAEDETSSSSSVDPEFRTIFLIGDVTEALIRQVVISLFWHAEADALKPINLVVNTYGGSIDETFAVYDAMKMSPAPIRTIGLGKIMSAGCLILSAGQKGHRMMGRNARLMYHAGYELNGGDVVAQQNNLKEFTRTERQYDALVAKETGKTLKQVQKLYQQRRVDRYMTAQECLRFGFVDKLV